jgi:hypothetical protein
VAGHLGHLAAFFLGRHSFCYDSLVSLASYPT